MNKKLFNFRFKPALVDEIDYLQKQLNGKNRTDTIEKAIKKLLTKSK
jgi:metal-responsive CopG/Arc/MetJ family transcriptional regulator